MKPTHFLPPPVTQSDEEPIAAGGWQVLAPGMHPNLNGRKNNLPPLVTQSDEEPIAAGGRYF
jgi:hypothetical protein